MKKLGKIFVSLLAVILSCSMMIACDREQDGHMCEHVCPTCGKCLDETCEDPVCENKCEGHNQTNTHTVTVEGASESSSYQVADGETAQKPVDPQKSGYDFVGWYVGDTEYDWNTPVTKDITITAKFRKLFDLRNGSAVKNADGSYTTKSGNTLITFDQKFTKGTLTGKVIPGSGTSNACGVVFGAAESVSENWWETNEYYTVLINVNGTVLVSHVDDGWNRITNSSKFESSYNPEAEYTFKIQYNESLLVIIVNDVEVYRNSQFVGLPGAICGYRAAAAGTIFKEIAIDENELPEDNSAPVVDKFIVRNGKLSVNEGVFTADEANTLAVHKEYRMIDGTISVKMKAGDRGDNGIVFGMTQADSGSFWEAGASYYFFFINVNGSAHLGKVNANAWKDCGIIDISGYNVGTTYTLKVEVKDGTIRCYVNDVQYITFTDESFLVGQAVGLRAGTAKTTYTDFTVSAETVDHVKPDGYTIVSGDFEKIAGQISSASANAMMISETETVATNGTISAQVLSGSDSGIVFGVKSGDKTAFWEGEEGISYYFFFINSVGAPILAKVAPNYQAVKASTLSAMYSKNSLYDLRVVVKDDYAYCYVGDRLMIKSAVTLDGSGVGLRAQKSGVVFKNVSVSDETTLVTANTLIFGHSYTQLWATYQSDFYDVENILNIGIGGTIAPDWLNLVDEVATYNPSTLIYMIGINDMSPWNGNNATGAKVSAIAFDTINKLHEKLPDAKIVLINCNKVPLAEKVAYYDEIVKLNAAYAEFAAKAENQSWCKVVDFASAVLDKNGNVDSSVFVADKLHLNATGYQKLTKLVRVALGLDEKGVPYDFVNGTGTYAEDGKVVSTSEYMLAINNESTFAGGTISAKIKMTTLSDSGIVFGLSDGGLTSYWETGVSYYEFFLAFWGGVYLAKIDNGVWNSLRNFSYGIQENTEYTLKVEWVNGNIRCYVNDVLCINYTDDNPLEGNKYGYRACGSGVEYGVITTSASASDLLNVTDYKLVSGGAKEQDGKVVSVSPNVLAVNSKQTFSNGTLTTTIKTVAGSDSGIVFGLSDGGLTNFWDAGEGVNYYFLFINMFGDLLLCKANPWTDVGKGGKIDNFDANKTYTLKVEWNGSNIKCYVDDELYIDVTDDAPLSGNKYGYRAQVIGVEYGAITINASTSDQQETTD